MIDRNHLIGLLIVFIQLGDGDLLDEDKILSEELCDPADRCTVRELKNILTQLIENFSYLRSPRFHSEIEGKSEAYAQMYRRRCDDPVRRISFRESFCDSLKNIEDDEVLDFVPPECQELVFSVRLLLAKISNPTNT